MRTRSSSNLHVVSPLNPSTSNPKRRNRRRSKQPFILEESLVDTMADQRTMVELLRAPTEGYAEAIVVPPILAEQFKLKYSLINMMTSDQFFGLERTILMITSVDLVSKFINEFFPSSRTTNLRNEISNFQQRFDESFHEAWDRYKDLLCACPHHGFTELHQLDTFYNALNPADQDSLNYVADGNLLERRTQDVLTIIENKSKIAKLTHAVNKQTSAVTTAMTAILKQFQATPPPAFVKAVEEICVTRGGAHPYYQCLAVGGNTFPELRDNIQGYVAAAAVNYNQGCSSKKKEKDKVQIHKFWQMFKQLHINITLADALILMPKYEKMLKALLSNKEKLQELENTPLNENCSMVILKKLPKKLEDPEKFLIPGGFSELKCKALADLGASINLMPLSMILRDGDERLTLNMRHDTSSYSNQPQKESITLINILNDSNEDFLEDLFSTNQPSGNPTFSSHPELTSSEVKDDIFDPDGCNVLPKKFLDLDSTKDLHTLFIFQSPGSIDQSNLANLNDNFVDSMPEMFTDEHTLDYSSPPLFDEYDDDIFEVESDTENVYDDPFDSKGEKIKESKLLIDELDLPCDFLPSIEYDSILSEDFSKVDALLSTNNEDKLAISHASLMIEDFDPPLYELPFFKEVPRSKILLLFSSENEETFQTRDSHF
nr:reverse transcriptase domain-containing protein [Tanacetum cinerariifolium]